MYHMISCCSYSTTTMWNILWDCTFHKTQEKKNQGKQWSARTCIFSSSSSFKLAPYAHDCACFSTLPTKLWWKCHHYRMMLSGWVVIAIASLVVNIDENIKLWWSVAYTLAYNIKLFSWLVYIPFDRLNYWSGLIVDRKWLVQIFSRRRCSNGDGKWRGGRGDLCYTRLHAFEQIIKWVKREAFRIPTKWIISFMNSLALDMTISGSMQLNITHLCDHN